MNRCDEVCYGCQGLGMRLTQKEKIINDQAERITELEQLLHAVYQWQDCDTASQSKRAQMHIYELVKQLRKKQEGEL